MVHSLSHFPAILGKLNALCTHCIILCNTVYMFDPARTSYIFLFGLFVNRFAFAAWRVYRGRGRQSLGLGGVGLKRTSELTFAKAVLQIYQFTSIDFDLLHNFQFEPHPELIEARCALPMKL